MFPLCFVCATIMNQSNCSHYEVERCLLNKLVVNSGCKAVELGYSLIEVFSNFGVYCDAL
jgi:hypothetical protein